MVYVLQMILSYVCTRFVIIREGITPPGLRLRVFNAGMPCYNGKRIFNDEGRKKKQRKQTIDENKDDCYGDMIISFAIHIPPNIRKHLFYHYLYICQNNTIIDY